MTGDVLGGGDNLVIQPGGLNKKHGRCLVEQKISVFIHKYINRLMALQE